MLYSVVSLLLSVNMLTCVPVDWAATGCLLVFSNLQDQFETSDSSICTPHSWIKRPRLSSDTSSGWRAWVSYRYRKRHAQKKMLPLFILSVLDSSVLNLWLSFLTQNSKEYYMNCAILNYKQFWEEILK